MAWALVGIGGAFGAMLRYAVAGWAARTLGTGFPVGTLIVNIAGSLLMGFLAILLIEAVPAREAALRPLLLTGLLGGFTTFSAFSLDAFALAEQGRTGAALGYVLGSVLLSLLALVAGIVLARRLVA